MRAPMKSIANAILIATLAFPAHAALSGFHDSAEQITAILESPEIADAVHQAPIESLENEGVREDGAIKWEIETQRCDLTVYLRPVPPSGVGKTTYRVEAINRCE